MGQGAIVDRNRERLGKSDAGIVLLRRIFWREMEAIGSGGTGKQWRRIEEGVELPVQGKVKMAEPGFMKGAASV